MKRLIIASCWLVMGCDVSASQPTDAAKAPQTEIAAAPVVEREAQAEPEAEPDAEPEAPALRLAIVELKPSAGPLEQQLRLHAKRGAEQGQRVVLEMGAPWCPPCKRAKALLAEEGVAAQLEGVVLLRANSDVWGEDLDKLGFDAPVIPVYYALDEQGGPSGDSVRGDRWKRRDQVRAGLLAFLRGA